MAQVQHLMVSDGPKPVKKTWEELMTAASLETDPEKLAAMMEEIFAALEARKQSPPQSHDPGL